ncbi:5-oxoprolinase subunit PxpB [Marinobacterium sediminicola]|uniref:Sensor histidine kinase inhibitor, KipI family n=1 Tax=Marinobacterium sediminicola TaxID=518898 RepID=A0ABY1S2P6_9GAMM|nr:5-oxoprolinase subunit PxpB [Marinobacterium sediminicola]ULG68858.1 5-oxoprolinase subunit PxpB [Marinobacterium sediminicola]SMR77532.1 sensor histidine kinase inhibitor, KipI family [Marinobacterium sediminicola]
MIHWSIDNAGPDALIIRFGRQIDEALVPVIRCATDRLASELGDQLRDLVPSYTSLMVVYNPLQTDFAGLVSRINGLLSGLDIAHAETGRLVEIPVYYAPEVGPDLERVAQLHGIDVDEVIHLHSAREYHVFAIGFAPGFAYMGQVDTALRTPRLETPRTRVPRGSVALADQQTAVYPLTSPGGWNLLGRTAMKMFDPTLDRLCPVSAGDRVRFVPITQAEYLAAGGELM